jgi:hypothetical protein
MESNVLETLEGNELSRRSLLAGAVVGATAIMLPAAKGSALARYPIPPASDEFCVNSRDHGPDRIYPTRADAGRHDYNPPGQSTFEMRQFVPLDAPARFRVMQVEWEVPAPHDLGIGDISDARREKLYTLKFTADDELRRVESLVDVFHGIAGICEWIDDDGPEVYDRETGLARVAAENAKLLEQDNLDWCVLVEIGKPVSGPLVSLSLCANGIGKMDVDGRAADSPCPSDASRACRLSAAGWKWRCRMKKPPPIPTQFAVIDLEHARVRLRHASRAKALDWADVHARLMGAAIIIPDEDKDFFEEADLLRTAVARVKPPTSITIAGCNEEQFRVECAIDRAIKKERKRRRVKGGAAHE